MNNILFEITERIEFFYNEKLFEREKTDKFQSNKMDGNVLYLELLGWMVAPGGGRGANLNKCLEIL